jgi:hypothetical protein
LLWARTLGLWRTSLRIGKNGSDRMNNDKVDKDLVALCNFMLAVIVVVGVVGTISGLLLGECG